jgi:hypothetical protein
MLPKNYVVSELDLIIVCLDHSSNLKTEAVRSSETSVDCRIRRHGIPDKVLFSYVISLSQSNYVEGKRIGLKWLRQVPVCCGSTKGVCQIEFPSQ